MLILSVLALIWLATGISWRVYELRDDDPNRGTITNGTDKFGAQFSQTVCGSIIQRKVPIYYLTVFF